MIYLKMRGGRLGNQMFQYAFARMLKEYNPRQELCVDFSAVFNNSNNGDGGYENSLVYFNTIKEVEKCNSIPKYSFVQKLIMHFYYRWMPPLEDMAARNTYQMRWCKCLNKAGLYFLDLGYYDFDRKLDDRNIVINGCFESEKYFECISDIIKREFIPKHPLLKKNEDLMKNIQNSNSVFFGVRMGDFVSLASRTHSVCTKKYYIEAVRRIKEKIENPTFFFFSNDIEWVKENIHIDAECYYESGNDPVWETLRLMSSCKHFIISNSTFHWWAQYLSKNPNKIVIAPDRWYNNDFVPALYQDNWEVVSV